MFGLEYGSDDEDEENETETPVVKVPPPPPPTPASSSSTSPSATTTKSSGGLQLPPPTSKSTRRKDGPVKIKIDALQPSVSNEPTSKKPRIDDNAPTKGAGSSSLVGMLSKLPAPKVAPAAEPVKKVRVLGGGVSSGDNPGVIMMGSSEDSGWNAGVFDNDISTSSATSFLPPSLKGMNSSAGPSNATAFVPPALKAKAPATTDAAAKPPISMPVVKPKPAAPAIDFFGLGPVSTPSTSSIPSHSTLIPAPSVTISSAPKVVEYEPPPPSTTDPYPGYYQKPSGDWAAYDPAYYKSFWETWNTDAANNVGLASTLGGSGGDGGKGKRKDRGWEAGVDEDSLMDANASCEDMTLKGEMFQALSEERPWSPRVQLVMG